MSPGYSCRKQMCFGDTYFDQWTAPPDPNNPLGVENIIIEVTVVKPSNDHAKCIGDTCWINSDRFKRVRICQAMQLGKFTVPIAYPVAGKRVLSPLRMRIRYP